MNQAKKLLFYIGLNFIVSITTVFGVLYVLDKTQLKDFYCGESTSEVSPAPGEEAVSEGDQELLIVIEEVGGVGNLSTEYIRLKRPNSDPGDTVSLQGWRLVDEGSHDYVILEQSGLPSLDLHGQGAVIIYSKEGASTPIELYLGLTESIWEPGETISLIDPQGNVHDTYLIP
jgi:hypothetical protein